MRICIAALTLTFLSGCPAPVAPGGCVTSRNCAEGDICVDRRCVTMPPADAARDDAAVRDSGAPDAATLDAAASDAHVSADAHVASDAASPPDTGPSDAGIDGCTGINTWGVADDSTADVYGDDFGRRVLDVTLCAAPLPGRTLALHVRARITRMGTELPYDIFGTYVGVNAVSGYRDALMTWTYVTVSGTAFVDYVLTLPADLDGNGSVDWVAGHNRLEVSTWSDYNDRPSDTGVDSLELVP